MDRVYGSERALTVGQARDRPTHLVGSSPTGHPSYLGHSDSNGVTLGQAQGSVKAAPLVRSQAARPEGSPQVGNVWTERPKSNVRASAKAVFLCACAALAIPHSTSPA